MKTIKKIAKNASKELVTKMVARDEGGWPPICTSFVYQPMRPKTQTNNENTESTCSNEKLR